MLSASIDLKYQQLHRLRTQEKHLVKKQCRIQTGASHAQCHSAMDICQQFVRHKLWHYCETTWGFYKDRLKTCRLSCSLYYCLKKKDEFIASFFESSLNSGNSGGVDLRGGVEKEDVWNQVL